jgi:hypothetical protein
MDADYTAILTCPDFYIKDDRCINAVIGNNWRGKKIPESGLSYKSVFHSAAGTGSCGHPHVEAALVCCIYAFPGIPLSFAFPDWK